MGLLKNLFDYETKELKKINKIVDEIEALDEEMQKITEVEFKAKTEEFKKRLTEGETLDDILSICYYYVGNKKEGLKHINKALKINPNNERIMQNKKFFE